MRQDDIKPVGFRGETPLGEKELCAHIAALLRLENIGVLLGAGASVCAGGRTMAQTWEKFCEKSQDEVDWLRKGNFLTDQYTATNAKEPIYNIESILDKLNIAIADLTRIDRRRAYDVAQVRAKLYKGLIDASILNRRWWKYRYGNKTKKLILPFHQLLLQKIVSTRQPGQPSPWIFTTNFDLAVEWAADVAGINVINGFFGSQLKRFDPQMFDLGFRNVRARGEAQFGCYNIYLAKMHGSLNWITLNDELVEFPSPLARIRIERYLNDRRKNGIPPFSILASGSKYFQTVGFAYGEIIRRYAEFVSQPQSALLVYGYSFSDRHLNRLFSLALNNPTFHLVIFLREFGDLDNVGRLSPGALDILNLKNPRITFVGGDNALFECAGKFLPDPTVNNKDMAKIEEQIRALETN